MKVKKLNIEGVKVIELNPIYDERGFFSRNYDMQIAKEGGFHQPWVQENVSLSKTAGTLRGIHFQLPPFSETKLVRVLTGSVMDVFVDLRRGSKTFGQWGSYKLDSRKPEWIYLPKGIGHGMITLEDNMLMQYKVDSTFNPDADTQIKWNDPDLGIQWPREPKIISEKDQNAMSFSEFQQKFVGLEIE